MDGNILQRHDVLTFIMTPIHKMLYGKTHAHGDRELLLQKRFVKIPFVVLYGSSQNFQNGVRCSLHLRDIYCTRQADR